MNYKTEPSKFTGRPKLPKYKDKTKGRNLLVYTIQALSSKQLKKGIIKLLGITVDNTDNLYVTGLFDGSIGGIKAGSFDAGITKFDAVTGIGEEFSSTSNTVNASPATNLPATDR